MICIILTCVFLVLYFLFKIFELHILKWEARTRDGNHIAIIANVHSL